jgi:hypothetical protein
MRDTRRCYARSMNRPILAICFSLFAACSTPHPKDSDREALIVGKWEKDTPGRPGRIVVFHSDHSWGVLGYVPDREDIRGRRWDLAGDKLILTYPGDHGLDTAEYKIISFARDKIVTDPTTYTREK